MLNRGHVFTKDIIIKQNDVPVNITGWQFRCVIMDNVGEEALLELTTANGGYVVADGGTGRTRMTILANQQDALPDGMVSFFVSRTNSVPGPSFLFSGRFKVKTWEET